MDHRPQRPERLPEWQVGAWLNTPRPITLASLRGKVVLIHAFQMLCPGCVAYGLPQAERVRQTFGEGDVAVVGLHTVFEHHAVMTPEALRAFVHEYRWSFPIGIDEPSEGDGGIPRTMAAYRLRGTPSHIVLDRQGFVRMHHFGRLEDLALGALIGQLLSGPEHGGDTAANRDQVPGNDADAAAGCASDRCA